MSRFCFQKQANKSNILKKLLKVNKDVVKQTYSFSIFATWLFVYVAIS